jgi:hypothetical protein
MAEDPVPVDNPWARPPPPTAPPPTPDGAAAAAAAAPGARAAPLPPARGRGAAAPPPATYEPPVAVAGGSDDATGGGRQSRRELSTAAADGSTVEHPGAPGAAAAAGGGGARRSVCHGCRLCCVGMHRWFVEGNACGGSLLALLAVACLGLFGFSAYLLPPHPTVGSACDDDACVTGVAASDTCIGFASEKSAATCSSVCDSYAGPTPFRFTLAEMQFAVDAGHQWISCPFPRANTNWRLTTTFFSGLLLLAAVVGYWLRWRRPLALLGLCALTAGGIMFYVIILDADSVVKATTSCAESFARVTTAYGGVGLVCDQVPYAAVAVMDAFLCPLLVSVGVEAGGGGGRRCGRL